MLLSRLTKARYTQYYRALTERVKVDTHRNSLAQVKTFLSYCAKQKFLLKNPAEDIERIGRRVRGKERLRVNEARAWVRDWTKKICRLANVPEITAHGLRGLHARLAESAGVSSRVVALSLGHENPKVTHEHYTKPEAVDKAKQSRFLEILQGGKS